MAASRAILVKVSGDGNTQQLAMSAVAGFEVEPILHVPPTVSQMGTAPGQSHTWLRVSMSGGTGNPWDDAHGLLAPTQPFAAALNLGKVVSVEPDLEQQWAYADVEPEAQIASNDADRCGFIGQSEKGGCSTGPGVAWNLLPDYSGLKAARDAVEDKMSTVKIAHLDTGYDPRHATLPLKLLTELQRNFVDKQYPTDASDRTPEGKSLVRNRGHGTATLCLLAGKKLDGHFAGWDEFADFIGGAPLAQVIPIRIADWVVRLTTSTMVQGFEYAIQQKADVLTMSMGGVSSHALVDAVNLAYESGMFMVTAAGNNLSGIPSPKSIVFPARYRRVLAACGVMADGRSYSGLSLGTMQGNFGPASKMETALGAYTPNVPWAKIDCQKIVDMDGGGTSAATPQIAAAAALWMGNNWAAVQAYSRAWMRVEAARKALFDSASRTTKRMNEEETRAKLGRGVLRADLALAERPAAEKELTMLPPAQASWSWLNVLIGGGVSIVQQHPPERLSMFALELTQMAQRITAVAEAIDDPDQPVSNIPASQRLRYLEAALDAGDPSQPLKAYLAEILKKRANALSVPAATTLPKRIKRAAVSAPVPQRRLRVYALDPSLGKRLDSLSVNHTTLRVPWEGDTLLPGPVGEYLEVVDVDPASNRVYQPVDLNDRTLLAQDGWPPSEGNPQFHQQMVYAVGMTTISHFERALGRKALWSAYVPDPPPEHESGPFQVLDVRL